MAYLSLSTYRNLLFYSYLVFELELFQSGQWFLCIWLYKNWKLYYQISVLVYAKCYQFHVIIFVHFLLKLNHNSYFFDNTCFTSCNILANLESGKSNIGKYPFDNTLIACEYYFNWFTNLSYI